MTTWKKWMALLSIAATFSLTAHAADYPLRPVTIVVPFAAGASLGSVAHIVAERLATRLGQPFIVEYKAGASGTIGTGFVAKAKPDGYTFLVSATGPMSIVPIVYKSLPYEPADLAPVAQFMRVPFVVATSPSFKGANVKELVELIKQNPGKYNYASTGNGTLVHLAGQMLLDQTGGVATHVPYASGAQVATALMRGDVLYSVANISTVSAYFADGRIKPLATTGSAKFPLLPELPTVAESGFQTFEVSHYVGLFGPKGIPDDITDKLRSHIAEILREPSVQQAFRTQGDLALSASREEFEATVRSAGKKWSDMARAMNLKNE